MKAAEAAKIASAVRNERELAQVEERKKELDRKLDGYLNRCISCVRKAAKNGRFNTQVQINESLNPILQHRLDAKLQSLGYATGNFRRTGYCTLLTVGWHPCYAEKVQTRGDRDEGEGCSKDRERGSTTKTKEQRKNKKELKTNQTAEPTVADVKID